jgi:hypothetical protein
VGLDLERHPCPWILLWAGQGKVDGFRFGSGFAISIQTRSIAILLACVSDKAFWLLGVFAFLYKNSFLTYLKL